MGNGCSAGAAGRGDLHMDGPPLEVRVPAHGKADIALHVSAQDNARLLGALREGKPSCMELTLTCQQGQAQPASLSMWVVAPDGSEGRLLRPFRAGEQQFRVQVLAAHTLNYRVGFYRVSLEGATRDSRVHVQCKHSTALPSAGSSGGWSAETIEQQRDRLLLENRELQLLVEKQKEFILILKRKFLEKGDALTDAENAILEQKQKRVKFIIHTWRMKTIVPVFLEWRKYCKERKERKKVLLGKIVLRMANAVLWRAFRTWTHVIEGDKVGGLKQKLAEEKGKRARQLIHAWRMRSMTPVFDAWKSYASSHRTRKRQLMGKIVLRMQNASLWSAWRTWTKLIDGDRVRGLQKKMDALVGHGRRARIEAFLQKWRGRTLIPKFQAWRRYAHEHRGRKRILLGKVVVRLGNAKLFSAWRQWKRMIEDDKVNHLRKQLDRHKALRVKQLITMWRLRSLTPVFKAWRANVTNTRGRKKVLMAKVVSRMQNAKLWCAFRQWTRSTEDSRLAALQTDMKKGLHAQKKRRVQALMARWAKGTIVGTFKAWRTWAVKNRARKKELLGKVVRRMASANVWQAYRAWKKFTEHSRLDEMRDKIRNELMGTMMLNGGKGSGGGSGSGDYQALLAKYRSLKHKKLGLEASYDVLFKFLNKFRVQIAKCIEEEITRLTHHCKCDVCQTKRKMLTQNGINEWLFQFDREMVRFKYPA